MLKQIKFCLDYLRCLRNKEEGQAMVEYGLIIALIAIAVIAALLTLGPKIAGLFNQVSDQLPGSTGSST